MKQFLFILLFSPPLVFGGEPSPVAKQEINHLFTQLKNSGCEFNRNGSWYSASEAVDHLNKKYEYLLDKGLVSSTEDFITRAGTESSMSGKAYQVRCGGNPAVPSGTWLKTELLEYRKSRRQYQFAQEGIMLNHRYYVIGEEEKAIWRDPTGTGSKIIGKIFGSLQ